MDWLVIPKMKTRKERYSLGLELAHMSGMQLVFGLGFGGWWGLSEELLTFHTGFDLLHG